MTLDAKKMSGTAPPSKKNRKSPLTTQSLERREKLIGHPQTIAEIGGEGRSPRKWTRTVEPLTKKGGHATLEKRNSIFERENP